MREKYLKWTKERLLVLQELYAEGYDCAGAAARLSVILGRAVSEDSVRRASARSGLEPAAGRRTAPAPYGVLFPSDLPSHFKAPPPYISKGLAFLEQQRQAREAKEAATRRPHRVIVIDGEAPGDVDRLVEEAIGQMWAECCDAEAREGRCSDAEAAKAAAMKPPRWFEMWAGVLVVEVVEVDGTGAPPVYMDGLDEPDTLTGEEGERWE